MGGYYYPSKGKGKHEQQVHLTDIMRESSKKNLNAGNNKCNQSIYNNSNITTPSPTKIMPSGGIESFVDSFLSINNKYKHYIIIILLVILYFVKKSCY